MKKIILILIIFNIVNIKNVYAKEKEYIFTMSLSSVLYVREVREFYNVGDRAAIQYDYKNNNLLFFTKQECIDYTKNKILNYYNINYISGGLFIDTAFGGYGRYFCVKYKDVEKYIETFSKTRNSVNFEEFNKGENKNMPLFVDYKTIPEVYNSIFPLDKDQKEAVKITKKFDKEIHDIFKQRQREQDIKLIKENDLKPSFNCDNIDKLNDIEIEICKNNSLSKKDVELNKLYKEIFLKYKNNNNKEKIKQLIKEQKEWIKSLTINNLYQSYNQRINELNKLNNE